MKKLVLTQCTGAKYQAIRDIIYPNFRRYAERVGADFASMEELTMSSHAVLEKLRAEEYLDEYDRILLLDADLVIRPDCPDLFALVPEDCFGAYSEGDACRTEEERMERLRMAAATGEFYNLEPPKYEASKEFWNSLSYYNAGVMVLSRRHRSLLHVPPESRPLPPPRPGLICVEQGIVNFRIWAERPRVFHLPVCFNQMPWNVTRDYLQCSFIIHCAGLPFEERIRAMKHAVELWG